MAGLVCPPAMATVAGETVNLLVSLLVSVTITPSGGAGVGKVTAMGADWLGPTVTFEARVIVPALTTVTVADVSATLGRALAWMVALPMPAPFTATVVLVALPAKFAVGGTVATLVLLELKLMVKPPAGAGTDRFKVNASVEAPAILALAGKKLARAVTWTGWLTD